MTSLTVLCPNAHRIKIPTTPSKLLQEVFEEACMRQGYDQSDYGLQFQRKFLDLSLPVRLCGLPNNATLELSKREVSANDSVMVQVALQGSFGRHMQEFPVLTPLERILETFSALAGFDLLCTNEELVVPSIGYMNKTWKGADLLSKNTLKSIGIEGGGRALFRYSQVSVTAEELAAMRQRSAEEEARRLALMKVFNQSKAENEQRELLDQKYTKDVEEREKLRLKEMERLAAQEQAAQQLPSTSYPPVQQSDQPLSRLVQLQNALNTVSASLNDGTPDNLVDVIMKEDGSVRIDEPLNIQRVEHIIDPMAFANFKFPDVPVATFGDLMAADANKDSLSVKVPDRRVVMFERVKEIENEEVSDEFFELTVTEAKKKQRELTEQARQLSQQALLPRAFVEKRNKEKRMIAYKHTVIRIRFEERVFVQAQFLSVEPVERLFEFVAGILRPDTPEFSLTLPLNEKLERTKNRDLIDAGVAPVTTVTIRLKSIQSTRALVRTESLQQCTAEEADAISKEWLSSNSVFHPEVFTVAAEPETQLKKRNREEAALSSEDSKPYQPSNTNDPKPKWFKH